MKNLILSVALFPFFVSSQSYSETTIKEKIPSSAGDSSILIERRVNPKLGVDRYEILTEEEEIAGEPTAGTKESYKAWKDACAEWKKEIRENNKENQIIILSCGVAKMEKDGTGSGVYTYKSNGKLKVKVKIESAQK